MQIKQYKDNVSGVTLEFTPPIVVPNRANVSTLGRIIGYATVEKLELDPDIAKQTRLAIATALDKNFAKHPETVRTLADHPKDQLFLRRTVEVVE